MHRRAAQTDGATVYTADVLQALPERAEDADLRAWIDNPFVAGYHAAMNR